MGRAPAASRRSPVTTRRLPGTTKWLPATPKWLLHATAALAALAGAAPPRQGRACSCIVGSPFRLLTPAGGKAAPLNARVRAEVPAGAGGVVLQRLDGGEVPAAARAFRTGGLVDVIELTPRNPLAPATRYRVAQIDPARHPATVVFGSFQTGDAVDKAPPRLEPLGQATGRRVSAPQGSACEVEGPWVEIEGVRASDAGRPEAQLAFGVWAGDAAGRVDATKPPTAILSADEGRLFVGRSSLCAMNDFPFPKRGGPLWLGVAALDEAGNASPVQRLKVELPGGAP